MTEPAILLPDGRRVEYPAFLLDLDGTLIDFAPTPDSVIVPPALPALLRRLRARHGDAVAIVTGRPVASIDTLLGDAPFAVAGEHGAALRLAPGQPLQRDALPVLPREALARADEAAARFPGALAERKAHGVALHYRRVPAAEAPLRAVAEAIIAASPGFTLLNGQFIWEIRPEGIDKGSAVRALMAAAPFASRTPIFVGDDITDDDGIAAAVALGGVGLRLPTTFASPAEVRAWLAAA